MMKKSLLSLGLLLNCATIHAADNRAIVFKNGVVSNIPDADSLVVGSGIKTAAGDLHVSSASGNVAITGAVSFTSTTGSRAVYLNAQNVLTSSVVTDAELARLSGATSNLQAQLNAKATDNAVLHLSGNESASDTKTFTGKLGTDWLQSASGDDSLIFDGSTETATVTLPSQSAPWTVEFWLRAIGNSGTLVYGGGEALISLNHVVAIDGGACTGSTNVTDGAWHHVALVQDPAGFIGMKLWIDGNQDCASHNVISLDTIYFGSNSGSTSFYFGRLDEIRISNIERYSGSFSPATSFANDANTLAYWKLNDGTGTTATDASGNGNTLMLTDGKQWVPGVTATAATWLIELAALPVQGWGYFGGALTVSGTTTLGSTFAANLTLGGDITGNGDYSIGAASGTALVVHNDSIEFPSGVVAVPTDVADTDYTTVAGDHGVYYTTLTADHLITIDDSVTSDGQLLVVKNATSGVHVLTITPSASKTCDGATSCAVSDAYGSIRIRKHNGNYYTE